MKARINDISITPVKKYAAPKYPTKTDAKRSPDLLRKLPSRWEKNAKVVAAMGLIGAMTLASCGLLTPQYQNSSTWGGLKSFVDTIIEKAKNNNNNNNTENVIETTDYDDMFYLAGEPMPPSYLTEEDALAIIKTMAETYGLTLENDTPEHINVPMDLYDSEHKVGVDYQEYRYKYSGSKSYEILDSIAMGWFYDTDIWGNAECDRLYVEYTEKSNEIRDVYYETNYDEYRIRQNEAYEEYEAKIAAVVEEELREQVRDFIEWLQGQGII